MDRRIVIGYDGTDHARDALAFGVALAQATPASLTLVNAYYDLPGLPAPFPKQMREEAERALGEAGSAIPDELWSTKRLVAHRSPARALHEIAEEVDADLIVLGSCGEAAPGHAVAGHVARQVLDGSPCAVVIAPSGLRTRTDVQLDCVGVGVDGGDEASHAVAAAAELARAYNARLLLMAAVERAEPVLARYGGEAERVIRETMQSRADDALTAARDAAPLDVAVGAVKLEEDKVVDALTQQVSTADIDVLVVGSRGFGPLRRVLLGSVSDALMHDAPCALMVVPRGATVHTTAPFPATEPAVEAR